MIFLETDARTREEILKEEKDLRVRIKRLEKDLQAVRKNSNNQAHKNEENHILWSKERNNERAGGQSSRCEFQRQDS